jgi:hypothetical protein
MGAAALAARLSLDSDAALRAFASASRVRGGLRLPSPSSSPCPPLTATPSPSRFLACAQPTWTFADGHVSFRRAERRTAELPAPALLSRALSYATELERIV